MGRQSLVSLPGPGCRKCEARRRTKNHLEWRVPRGIDSSPHPRVGIVRFERRSAGRTSPRERSSACLGRTRTRTPHRPLSARARRRSTSQRGGGVQHPATAWSSAASPRGIDRSLSTTGRLTERPVADRFESRVVRGQPAATLLTFSAAGPFWPCTRSNSTGSPSASVLKPLPWMEL
jgi:hypothetical protein